MAASDYPNLDEKYWLKGPKNDAVLVRDRLLTSSPVPFKPETSSRSVPAKVSRAAPVTRSSAKLAAMAAKAKPGDFVFLQFSRHGSYQPATDDKLEQDGKDQIFLAADTGMAPKDNPRCMPNVITDNEFADAFGAIRKTGAFVWLVFNSCHSCTITRGAPGEDGDARCAGFRQRRPALSACSPTSARASPPRPAALTTRDSKQPRGGGVMVPLEVLGPTGDTPPPKSPQRTSAGRQARSQTNISFYLRYAIGASLHHGEEPFAFQ